LRLKKNTLIAFCFMLVTSLNGAQTLISVEEFGRLLTEHETLSPTVREVNDVNNFFDRYIGNWRSVHDNKVYEISLYEERVYIQSRDLYEERLSFSYKIKDSTTGAILADSSFLTLGDPMGVKYEPDSGFYELFMHTDCGESKFVSLGFVPDTMALDGTITVDNHMVFFAGNSTFHRPAGNGC
jgi:hypothetical protein